MKLCQSLNRYLIVTDLHLMLKKIDLIHKICPSFLVDGLLFILKRYVTSVIKLKEFQKFSMFLLFTCKYCYCSRRRSYCRIYI